VTPAKMAEWIEMPFGGTETHLSWRNHVTYGHHLANMIEW